MDRHQPDGIRLDALDGRVGLDVGGLLEVVDVIEEAAQVASLACFEAPGEAQQLVNVGQAALRPVEREHVPAIAARVDRALDQLRESSLRCLRTLALQARAEGRERRPVLAGEPRREAIGSI